MTGLGAFLPFLLSGGGVALLGFVYFARNKDANQAVATANLNVDMAMDLAKAAGDRVKELETQNVDLRAEVAHLTEVSFAQGLTIKRQEDEITNLKQRLELLGGDPS